MSTGNYRVAKYFRRGFTMSRRAYISHKKNEHPLTHWMKEFNLDKETTSKLLVFAGHHHTGKYAQRTKFYRLPDLTNEKERIRFFRTYHSIPSSRKKFFKYMSGYLKEQLGESSHAIANRFTKPEQARYVSLREVIERL